MNHKYISVSREQGQTILAICTWLARLILETEVASNLHETKTHQFKTFILSTKQIG